MNHRHFATLGFAAVLLTACGGGGDATTPTESPTPTPTPVGTPEPSSTPTGTPAPIPAAEPTTGYGFVPNGSGGNYGLNCVKDYATGLIWEGKNPANSSLHFVGRTYTNFDSTTASQKQVGTASPVAPTATEVNAATNSVGLKNATNTEALCGFTDWRLPTVAELYTLGDTSLSSADGGLAIDRTWFGTTNSGSYWSSDSSARLYEAGRVSFIGRNLWGVWSRNEPQSVRLVR
jgi:hypothetical protein